MIELISEEKIRSFDYLRIRCEFYDIWNKLFLNKNQIDKVVFRQFGRFWPLAKAVSLFQLRSYWFLPKFAGSLLSSELILRSNQLWMPRCWEYPWAILNSHLEPDTKILDIGSGWSIFPLYLAQKSGCVDSIDNDEMQMNVLSPVLADILEVKVNYSVGDTLNLSAENNTYDCVFCISVLEHLEEEIENGKYINKHARKLDKAAINECIRVVKPGGRVILTLDYANRDVSARSYDFDYLKDLIEEFKANLLKPVDRLEELRFTKEKVDEMRRLWIDFFPYDSATPPGGSVGVILTKQ